jgi:hypothetical protein
MHGLSGVKDCVAVYGDGIDVVETGAQTERAQRHYAAWLKKLADDAVWLGEGAFEEGYVEGRSAIWKSCGGECVCEGGACRACHDDDDVVWTSHGRYSGTSEMAPTHSFHYCTVFVEGQGREDQERT